jgi:DNA replication factor GINS
MEDDEEINYRTLRKIQQSEKKTPFLTQLYSGFYQDLQEHLDSMKQRLKEEKSETKINLLKNEIENNKKIILNIYEHREKKVVLAAVTKARGGDPDLKNILPSEKNIYDSIIEILKTKRNNFFEKKTKETQDDTHEEEKKEEETQKTEEEPVEELEEENDSEEESSERESNDNPVIRVIKNMPEFMGTDKCKYFLKKDDVLSIPEDMADMLEKRKAAEKIDYED